MFGIMYADSKKAKTGLNLESDNKAHVVKFSDDNFIFEDDDYKIAVEGYILNSAEILKETGCSSLKEAILNFAKTDDQKIAQTFKGSFVIVIEDKKNQVVRVINDLLSKKPVYFYQSGECFAFSTSFLELADQVKADGIKLTLNPIASQMMLRKGELYEDVTYANEISYLMPFQWLKWENGLFIMEIPRPEPLINVSQQEAISELDRRFEKACRLQYQKNASAGYKQVNSLSGGMDSRAVFLYGQKLGYQHQFCFTYAESGSMDQKIAQRIARDFGCEHVFHAIDQGNFMLNREAMIQANEGQVYYAATTGLWGFIQSQDTSNFGLVHTGSGGGEIMGDIIFDLRTDEENESHFQQFIDVLNISDQIRRDELKHTVKNRYRSYNEFVSLNFLRACLDFPRISQNYFEVASPFLYEDFFCYAISLPADMKLIRQLYRAWYNQCIPNNYKTTKFWGKMDCSKLAYFIKKDVIMNLKNRLHIKSKYDMNPFNYWWKSNPELRQGLDRMFAEDIECLSGIGEKLKGSLVEAYKKNLKSKAYALTVSWIIKRMGFES